MTKLTANAVNNLDLLHEIEARPGASITALGRDLDDRDQSNLTKTIKRLREEGVIDPHAVALTDDGKAIVRLASRDGELIGNALEITTGLIRLNPNNPRRSVDAAELEELTASIREKGVLQPIIVRPVEGGYEVVIGERRFRASMAADRPTVPAFIRHYSDAEALEVAITENVQRADLHRVDEALGYKTLRDDYGHDADHIARMTGKSRKHVADHIALIEKLSEAEQARMRLPDDDPDFLSYTEARKLIQGQNARPKPALLVTPEEALALLEIAEKLRGDPSHDPLNHGTQGWTRIERGLPSPLSRANALAERGLVEFGEPPTGEHAYVRWTPSRAMEIASYLNEHHDGPMALWSARTAVAGSGVAADLERFPGRYATAWLNAPLPPAPEPQSAGPHGGASDALAPPAPQPRTPPASRESPQPGENAPHSPHPPAEAGEVARASETEGAFDDDNIPDHLLRLAGVRTPAAEEPRFPVMTDAQQRVLHDVAAKTAADPTPSRGNSYVGAVTYDFHKHPEHQALVMNKLLMFVQPARGTAMLAVITERGHAWLDTRTPDTRSGPPPYATAWLNPPLADEPPAGQAPPAPKAGAEPTFVAKPVIEAVRQFVCGNCEEEFPSPDIVMALDADANRDIRIADEDVAVTDLIPPEGDHACPHCGALVELLTATIYFRRAERD